MKTLVFDIYGDFGHFKKFYTTSSPLTFSFPPPPTVKGILGAIIGADKESYLEVFSCEKCKIAVEIISPVKKMRMGLNHINTKGNFWIPTKKGTHEARTQIRTEFLVNPAYRIYVAHNDEKVFAELARNIQAHKTVFTISLGLSELLADFRFIEIAEFKEKNDCEADISTVIPMSVIKEYGIKFEEDKKYFKEKLAVDMTPERVVERYEDIIFEIQGKSINADMTTCWEGQKGEHIVFF